MPLKRARLRISDYNKTRKSRLEKQERRIRSVSLSLTSMVDMFAILVIFLLSNPTSVSQWIELAHKIELPKAKFSDTPKEAASISIARDEIYVDRDRVASIAEAQSGNLVSGVKAALAKLPKSKDGYVNVVADTKVNFGVIRRIIYTCEAAGYPNVNLAVSPKASSPAAAPHG